LSYVPIAVVAPLIRRWLEVYKADRTENDGYATTPKEGHLSVLSFQCGVSPRTLRQIVNNKKKDGRFDSPEPTDKITFDMADKIVCATIGPWGWRTEESLIPYYGPVEVSYSELRNGYELPEGYEFETNAKRYLWNAARLKQLKGEEAA
jgi:hypothetical protein